MNLTNLEKAVVTNILRGDYAPGGGQVSPVWSSGLDCGPGKIDSKSIPGVVGSLSKKGLLATDGTQVWITVAGITVARAHGIQPI